LSVDNWECPPGKSLPDLYLIAGKTALPEYQNDLKKATEFIRWLFALSVFLPPPYIITCLKNLNNKSVEGGLGRFGINRENLDQNK